MTHFWVISIPQSINPPIFRWSEAYGEEPLSAGYRHSWGLGLEKTRLITPIKLYLNMEWGLTLRNTLKKYQFAVFHLFIKYFNYLSNIVYLSNIDYMPPFSLIYPFFVIYQSYTPFFI